MFIDSQLLFSDAQAVSADAASTNLIDLAVARRIFNGTPLAIVIQVDVAADTASGDETYSFNIQTDDNASFSSATTLIAHAIDKASLTAGSLHFIPIPIDGAVERYLRLYYDVGGTTPSVTVTAFLTEKDMVQLTRNYASGVTIAG